MIHKSIGIEIERQQKPLVQYPYSRAPQSLAPRESTTMMLVGEVTVDIATNAFTLVLRSVVKPPVPPPVGTVIYPTGGDDTSHIQNALNALPDGETLTLSGMFQVSNSIWLVGNGRTIAADPATRSGFVSTSANLYSGHYGALLNVAASGATIQGLEFDAAGYPTELVFFDGGSNNTIADCYLLDISLRDPDGGAPYAVGHGSIGLRCLRNRVERTQGIEGRGGVRGIWLPVQEGCLIEGNTVNDTGHTGIAFEGPCGTIRQNHVKNVVIQGTGLKIDYRPGDAGEGFHVEDNTVDTTHGGGIMLEDLNGVAVIEINRNHWINCGKQGTSFGAIYAPTPTQNINFHDNTLDNCRSQGGLIHVSNSTFVNNTITGPGHLSLEDDCHEVQLTNSGTAAVGTNCSGIWQDGSQMA
jgi:hypothetical protein